MIVKRDETVILKVSRNEKKAWKKFAMEQGLDLSSWIRFTLNGIIFPPKNKTQVVNDEAMNKIQMEVVELSMKLKSIEANIPEFPNISFRSETIRLANTIKTWLLDNKPKSEKEIPDFEEWFEGSPSAFETAMLQLRKDGILTGTNKWKFN